MALHRPPNHMHHHVSRVDRGFAEVKLSIREPSRLRRAAGAERRTVRVEHSGQHRSMLRMKAGEVSDAKGAIPSVTAGSRC